MSHTCVHVGCSDGQITDPVSNMSFSFSTMIHDETLNLGCPYSTQEILVYDVILEMFLLQAEAALQTGAMQER
eukprot:UN26611